MLFQTVSVLSVRMLVLTTGDGTKKNTRFIQDGGVNDNVPRPMLMLLANEQVLSQSTMLATVFLMLVHSYWQKLLLHMHCWGENPVVTAKLQLNGQDRFSEREGSYFDLVQPFQHHTRTPDTGINVYSFSLRPEEHQPSGTVTQELITLLLQLVASAAIGSGATAKVRVYATNYNVLRVMSGMGGLILQLSNFTFLLDKYIIN